MTGNISIVLRAELLNLFNWNIFLHEKDTKKKNRTLAMFIAIGIIAAIMAGYCFVLAYGFGTLQLSEIVPGYAFTITGLVILIATFFKAPGVLFVPRDYDLLMSLPLHTAEIITAKFFSMYIRNLLFAVIVMIPMGAGYMVWNPLPPAAIIMWIAGTFVAPLLPMTVSVIISTVITAIGAGFRRKTLVQITLQIILAIAVLAGIFCISFWSQNEAIKNEAAFLSKLAGMGKSISDSMHRLYPLSAWFDRAIQKNAPATFLQLAGISILLYIIFVCICGMFYGKINTALLSHHAKSNYRLSGLKTNSVIMALVKKEAGRFFISPLYFINMGIGLIIAVILSVVCLFTGTDKIYSALAGFPVPDIIERIAYTIPFAIAMIVNMSCTSAVSLSLEGRNLWIVQSLPITRKTLLNGKMLFNILLTFPVSFICSVIFIYKLNAGFILSGLYIMVSVAAAAFSTVWGMKINLLFPNFQWENEVEVIKQGMSSMIGIFSSILGYLIAGAVVFFACGIIPGELVLLFMCALLLCAAAGIYRSCMKGGK